MPSRHPIGAADILNKSQTAGQNAVFNLFTSTATSLTGFGFNTGYFVGLLPATGVLVEKLIAPELAIRVTGVKIESDGTQGAGKTITISKVTSAGVVTTLFSVSLTTTANAIDVPLGAATGWAGRTLAVGDSLKIETSSLTVPAYVFIEFANV